MTVTSVSSKVPGEQWPILAALGELYRLSNEAALARELTAQAAKIVQALAVKIDDNVLRTRFLEHA